MPPLLYLNSAKSSMVLVLEFKWETSCMASDLRELSQNTNCAPLSNLLVLLIRSPEQEQKPELRPATEPTT
jgi:hypothetical protein